MSALTHQEGGAHYKALAIQPVEYIHANGIGFFEGSVIKYVTRWRAKGGIGDLRKARHFIDLLIQLEEGTGRPSVPVGPPSITAEELAAAIAGAVPPVERNRIGSFDELGYRDSLPMPQETSQ